MTTYKLGSLGSLLNKTHETSGESKLQAIFSSVPGNKSLVFRPVATYIKTNKNKKSLPTDEENNTDIQQSSQRSEKKRKKEKTSEAKIKSSKRKHDEIEKDNQELKNHESLAPRKRKKKQDVSTRDSDETENRTIFVGNLPTTVTKKILTKIFKKHGVIESIRFRGAAPKTSTITKKIAIIKKKFHDEKKNLNAYVRFESVANAEAACSLNGQMLDGLHMRVDMATRDKKHDTKQSVFIGNLPFNVTEEAVYDHFQQCGEVEGVRIIRDSATGAGKGFGYVMFKDSESVELALMLHERPFEERKIRVMRATSKPKKDQRNNRGGSFNSRPQNKKWKKNHEKAEPAPSFQGAKSDEVKEAKVQVKKNKKKKLKKTKIYFPGINSKK